MVSHWRLHETWWLRFPVSHLFYTLHFLDAVCLLRCGKGLSPINFNLPLCIFQHSLLGRVRLTPRSCLRKGSILQLPLWFWVHRLLPWCSFSYCSMAMVCLTTRPFRWQGNSRSIERNPPIVSPTLLSDITYPHIYGIFAEYTYWVHNHFLQMTLHNRSANGHTTPAIDFMQE